MLPGFYELLGVPRSASADDIRAAYQRQLASLVRRLRAANRQSADVTVLEAQERSLKEAFEILSDAARRRRYDAYRRASEDGLPNDAEDLWNLARPSLADPAAAAALETLRALTDLPLGEPIGPVPSEPPPPPIVERPRPVERVAVVAPPPPEVDEEPEPPRPRPRAAPPPEPPGPMVAAQLPPVKDVYREADEVLFSSEDAWDLFPDEEEDELSEPGRSALLTHGGSQRNAPRAAAAAAPAAPPPRPKDPVAALVERYGYDGRFLRGVRDLRGVTLDEVAKSTRISLRYLEALEENGYDRLPAGTFVRGYVRTLARMLQLDENTVADGYMANFNHHRG